MPLDRFDDHLGNDAHAVLVGMQTVKRVHVIEIILKATCKQIGNAVAIARLLYSIPDRSFLSVLLPLYHKTPCSASTKGGFFLVAAVCAACLCVFCL